MYKYMHGRRSAYHVVRTAPVERNPQSERHQQEIDIRLLIISAMLFLTACSTVDATVDGAGGIIKGVGSDTFGITAGFLDVTSNLIKDVAVKTGTAKTEPKE